MVIHLYQTTTGSTYHRNRDEERTSQDENCGPVQRTPKFGVFDKKVGRCQKQVEIDAIEEECNRRAY